MWVNLGMAAIPVALSLIILFAVDAPGNNHPFYQGFVRILYLHFIVFFVANLFGFAVSRQEMEDRTLHYLVMQPLSRWLLLTSRFVAYLVLAGATCVASLWLTYVLLILPGAGVERFMRELFSGGRLMGLVKESAVMVLALGFYGAIATVMGSIFKSGLYAALLIIWEAGVYYLPDTLKYFTGSHYFHSLLPEKLEAQRKLFEMFGEPASVGLSLGVTCGVSLALLAVAVLLFQFKECLYSEA